MSADLLPERIELPTHPLLKDYSEPLSYESYAFNVRRLEPAENRTQTSCVENKYSTTKLQVLAIVAGIEPATFRLEV